MKYKIESPKSSLKNNILITLFLIIAMWGIFITAIFHEQLYNILIKQQINKNVAKDICRQFIAFSTGATIVGFIAVLGVGLLLSRMITEPIRKLTKGIIEVARGNLNIKLDITRQDEIGQVTSFFNNMIEDIKNSTTSIENLNKEIAERKQAEEELKLIQESLIEASHQAGMAKVATNVLHNIGNVLNSINVSVNFIKEKILRSNVSDLEQISDIIADHKEDLGAFFTRDQRGKHIPVYLTEVVKVMKNEEITITERLQSLTMNVGHINEIIRSQQTYARAGDIEILTNVKKVIEDAIEINRNVFKQQELGLNLKLSDLPEIFIDKQRLLQILVNLINNGKYALSKNQKKSNLLTIRLYRYEKDRVRIEVSDNGLGIAQENLSKIFSYGFTTKKDGHGFGLHSAALAAKEMGGTLTVYSDGPGHGATFTLELPLKQQEAKKCIP